MQLNYCVVFSYEYNIYISILMMNLIHFKVKSEIIDYLESNEENISISLANIGIERKMYSLSNFIK